jgi:nitrite reductase/ring-hydroxylating ferredoxin subunit
LTRNDKGDLQAFYNVCTHAGSCLVGPWTTAGCSKLDASLVGQSTNGNLFLASVVASNAPIMVGNST